MWLINTGLCGLSQDQLHADHIATRGGGLWFWSLDFNVASFALYYIY